MPSVLRTIFIILLIADAAAMVIAVLMQQGKAQGLGALTGAATPDTYWTKNKGRSPQGTLKKATRIMAVIFIVLAVVLNIHV